MEFLKYLVFLNAFLSIQICLIYTKKTVFNNNNHIDEWVIHIDGDIKSAKQFADSHDLVLVANVCKLFLFVAFFKLFFLHFKTLGWQFKRLLSF